MLSVFEQHLLQHLSQFPTEHKKAIVERVLNQRTRYVTIVLEDIYQSQNASAAIRTCECMGLQDVHMIENTSTYVINPRILKGSEKWITIHKHNQHARQNTAACVAQLRAAGYAIYVADPAEGSMSVDEIPIHDKPVALLFGNERHGVSAAAKQLSDGCVRVPMYGFTESLNVSVSVALSLQSVLSRLRNSAVDYLLTEVEKDHLRLSWYKKIVRKSDVLEREFVRTIV